MSEPLPGLVPFGFENWIPLSQAATIALLTFVQEDVPAVTAALLAAAGRLDWSTAYLGCFFGIWIGDALLYLLARGVGRPLLETPILRRVIDRQSLVKSEKWFAQNGIAVLLSSRCIPGARLPTYLAAGFLKAPFGQFLVVTGIAVAVWTGVIFLLSRSVGPPLLEFVAKWYSSGWIFVLLAVVVALVCRFALRLTDRNFRRGAAVALTRWRHWEFWPAWLFYIPVALNYVRLVLRYRRYGGWLLPTASNPGIFSGGFVGESKMATLLDLHNTSPEFTATAWLVEPGTPPQRFSSLENLCAEHQIDCPFILKPDIGQRGVGVRLVRNIEEARKYLGAVSAPVLLQRYAPGPKEIGIFYYRFPNERQGRIFAITEKIFPRIVGDGVHTVEDLIWRDARARFLADRYIARLGNRRHEILAAGDTVKLVEAGNHAQGCIFQDGARLWSAELESRIDEISQKLNGFYVGRFDIRFASEEDLRAGRNFQIIELNGAAAEATNIYDARNSLVAAYRTLFRQWEIVFAIGAANRELGIHSTRFDLFWRKWRETSALVATYPLAD
jgi:membrane protein DedA with SNARE-associated domain